MKLSQINRIISLIPKGCTRARIDTVSVASLTGGLKNPMQGRVHKSVHGQSVLIFTNEGGSDYERFVRERLSKEGKDPSSFVAGERAWGKHLPSSPVVEHKGKFYLDCIILDEGDTRYFLEGKEIPEKDVIGLREQSSIKQVDLDNKVRLRCYSLDSIKAIELEKD